MPKLCDLIFHCGIIKRGCGKFTDLKISRLTFQYGIIKSVIYETKSRE